MELTAESLRALVMLSLRDPAAAARVLLSVRMPQGAYWMALALVVTLSVLVFQVSGMMLPRYATATTNASPPILSVSPALLALLLGSNLVLMVFGLHWMGRAMGGIGNLADMILVMSWLQFLLLLVQVIQAFLALLLPMVAGLVAMGAVIYSIWVLLNFLSVAHGYDSLGKSFVVLIMTILGISIGMSFILSLIGFTTLGAAAYV